MKCFVPLDLLKHRRAALAELLPTNSLLVLLSAISQFRNGDVEYPFRQESNFWYFTGLNEKNCAYLLCKDASGAIEEKIYLERQSLDQIKWLGAQCTLDNITNITGIYECLYADAFENDLNLLVSSEAQIWFEQFSVGSHPLISIMNQYLVSSPKKFFQQLRMVKDPWEIKQIQKAVDISIEAHLSAVKCFSSPSLSEYHIAAELEYRYAKSQCSWAYPSIVAGGINACTLHYTANDQPLKSGELCLIDAGCEYNYYAADITRTYPISGHYNEVQKQVYEIVLAAQQAAIDNIASADATMKSYHLAAVRVLVQGLIDLGVLQGTVSANIENRTYQKYYPHGTGHFLGLDVHDQGLYKDQNNNPTILLPGTAVTIEPGLYFAHDDSSVPSELRGTGIRIEDDIVKADIGIINITQALPTNIDEIEKLMV